MKTGRNGVKVTANVIEAIKRTERLIEIVGKFERRNEEPESILDTLCGVYERLRLLETTERFELIAGILKA
jgi:hypothetical protein